MATTRNKELPHGSGGGRRQNKETRVGIDVEIRPSRSKGGGGEIVPTLTIEREGRPERVHGAGGGHRENKARVRAEHLLDLWLERPTRVAKRIAVGDRVSLLGSGPRLAVLTPRGVLGLASRGASDTIRAALSAAPGARLESLVSSVGDEGVSVRVMLLGPATRVERSATRGGARPAAEDLAAVAALGRRGR